MGGWWCGSDQHDLLIDYHALGEQTNLVSSEKTLKNLVIHSLNCGRPDSSTLGAQIQGLWAPKITCFGEVGFYHLEGQEVRSEARKLKKKLLIGLLC